MNPRPEWGLPYVTGRRWSYECRSRPYNVCKSDGDGTRRPCLSRFWSRSLKLLHRSMDNLLGLTFRKKMSKKTPIFGGKAPSENVRRALAETVAILRDLWKKSGVFRQNRKISQLWSRWPFGGSSSDILCSAFRLRVTSDFVVDGFSAEVFCLFPQ